MKYERKQPRRDRRQAPPSGEYIVLDMSDRPAAQLAAPQVTPYDVGRIIAAANSGDTVELCKLAVEVEEKNWDIQNSMDTRRNALLGCDWHMTPGDDTPPAKEIAERFEKALRDAGNLNGLDTFYDLCGDLMGAVIAPFAASEVVWNNGTIEGFQSIEARHFTLQYGYEPRLITLDHPSGMELPPYKFIFHHNRRTGGDMARSGRIRTLAWLHVFQNFPMKDWLAFVERFGMPFIVARVSQNAWKNERDVIKGTIRAFGPSGGGVFTKETEVQLLQAANAGGGDNAYKTLLEYTGAAITKVLLGQLASSGEASGWSNGGAQGKVRQDILEADARGIEKTVTARLAAPWTAFNYGPAAPVPRLAIESEEPADEKAEAEVKQLDAQTIQTLGSAGWEVADPAVLKERFGIEFRKAAPAGTATPAGEGLPETAAAPQAETLDLKAKYDAMGVAIRAGLLTATPEIEEQTRRELGLPPISDAVRKAWDATGGIRQPIALKTSEAAAVSEALDVDNPADAAPMSAENRLRRGAAIAAAVGNGLIHRTADVERALARSFGVPLDAVKLAADDSKKKEEPPKSEPDALTAWLGPIEAELAALSGEGEISEEEFRKRLDSLAAGERFGDSAGFQAQLENTIYTGIAAGIAAGYKRGRRKK